MNQEIEKHVIKTGTVTIGIVCKDGVVLGADRRVSYAGGGGVVYFADKMKKILEITDRIITTVAGGAADAKKEIQVLRAEVRLKELRTREKASVSEVANLLSNMAYQNIRTPSMIPMIAHFLVAGRDSEGVWLYDVSPDGHLKDVKKYASSGAGIMQVDAILDSEYREGMSLQEAVNLIKKCIITTSGREPSVGAGMDIYTITKDSLKQVVEQEALLDFKDIKSK